VSARTSEQLLRMVDELDGQVARLGSLVARCAAAGIAEPGFEQVQTLCDTASSTIRRELAQLGPGYASQPGFDAMAATLIPLCALMDHLEDEVKRKIRSSGQPPRPN
jgi:hypothetical protein